MDEVKKALSSQHGYSRQLQEAAAIAAVNLCKASTYVNFSDRSNVLFSLVQSIVVDLKVASASTSAFCFCLSPLPRLF